MILWELKATMYCNEQQKMDRDK